MEVFEARRIEVEGMAPGPLLKEFFMALNWLRQYPTSMNTEATVKAHNAAINSASC